MATIYGTPFADALNGTTAADQLLGLGGDDHLYGGDGDDQSYGDAGDDVIDDSQGVDLLDGGEGNDTLILSAAAYAYASLSATGADQAYGGPGHDMLIVRGTGLAHVLSGGGGSDFFSFQAAPGSVAPATLVTFTVTDFSLPDEDRLYLAPGSHPYAWRGQAPAGFTATEGQGIGPGASGVAEIWTLAQGADAVVWVDLNANGQVDAQDLRLLLAGQAVPGPEAFGPGVLAVLQGTPGDDLAVLSPLDDWYDGNGGHDTVDGGDGIDVISTGDGDDELHGGAGRDQLSAGAGSNLVDGGAGDDYIDISGAAGSRTVATGGTGQDGFGLHLGGAQVLVTDFEPGPAGDVLDLRALFAEAGLNLAPFANPFDPALGHLRLAADPDGTDLQFDATGAGDGPQWLTLARLQGTPAFALTPDNLHAPGHANPLFIVPGNRAPNVANPIPDHAVDEDTGLAFIPSATTFDDNAPLTELAFTATLADGSPLPSWLQFSGGLGTYGVGVPGIGIFTGSPGNDDTGVLAVRVTATDAQGAQASDDFVLTVRNTNDAPIVTAEPAPIVASSGTFLDWALPEGTFVDIDPGDRLQISVTGLPLGPQPLPAWLQFDAASARLYGMPGPLDGGTVSLRFDALDLGGAVASVVVPLTVTVSNRPPQAVDDVGSTPAGAAVTLAVLANDSDPDPGQALHVTAVETPRLGRVDLLADGTLRYVPQGLWNGQESFAYTVDDGAGGQSSARVTIDVRPTLAGTDAANNLSGGSAADSIDARGGNDSVNGGLGDDFVRGGDGNDTLQGAGGNDTLLGGNGNDVLIGGAGLDVLAGGPGIDRIYTGSTNGRSDGQADVVAFDVAPNGTTNYDRVYGFDAGGADRIALDPAVFASVLGGASVGVDPSEFRSGLDVQAVDADDHLLYDTRTSSLYYDSDGSGPQPRALMAIFSGLVGVLDAGDFVTGLPPGV